MVVLLAAELRWGLSEIKGLTLIQIGEFSRAVVRKRMSELKTISNTIRVSAMGDKRAFSSFQRQLDKGIDKANLSLMMDVVETFEEFDWKVGKKGIVASNRSPEFFREYFKNKKKEKMEI